MLVDQDAQDVAARNREMFRRIVDDAFSQGKLEVVDEVLSSHLQEHQDGMGAGPEGLKGAITYLRSVFPDFTLTIEDMTTDQDKVWARLRARGTHQGPHMGMAPTGRRIDITVIDICRFEDGKMVEHWGVPDRFALAEQLGFFAGPPATTGN
jgi:predicted ester cyclase